MNKAFLMKFSVDAQMQINEMARDRVLSLFHSLEEFVHPSSFGYVF